MAVDTILSHTNCVSGERQAAARSGTRVCIVTSSQLATCPRMVKAADAFADAGYRVRVVSTSATDWAIAADQELWQSRKWDWTVVSYHRKAASMTYYRSGIRQRLARACVKALGAGRTPTTLAFAAFSRLHAELLKAVLSEKADLYYAGASQSMTVAVVAAKRSGVPYGLDLEDFYSDMYDHSPAARLESDLAERVEHRVLPGAAFLTAGSKEIAEAYADKYGRQPITVNNTFLLPSQPPSLQPRRDGILRLYWFGQTIGPGRGLEDAVRAVGLAGVSAELHLRGVAQEVYLSQLLKSAATLAPRLTVIHHPPAAPDRMVELCAGYDVGLALEQGTNLNRRICLTNKALTYVLGGLAVACTDTAGQRSFAEDLGEGAILFRPGDVDSLAAGLATWAKDPTKLQRARSAAWNAAKRRWHWDHPLEKGALLDAVADVLAAQDTRQCDKS